MSIRALNWAWGIALPPTRKVVLLALADIADDNGLCWPKHSTIAIKSTTDERTVRRVLAWLQSQRLISVEPRYRNDGSRTSNSYRLTLDHPPDKLSRGEGFADQGGGSHGPEERATESGLLTTTEPSYKPSPPPRERGQQANPTRVCGGGCDLIFPNALNQRQQQALEDRLGDLTVSDAQQILDELAGRMEINEVKNPIRYCETLIRRLQDGTFRPELGLKVLETRVAHEARAKARARTDARAARSVEPVRKLPEHLSAPLARIRAKSLTSLAADARLSDNPSNDTSSGETS